jgi:hypothetical protein
VPRLLISAFRWKSWLFAISLRNEMAELGQRLHLGGYETLRRIANRIRYIPAATPLSGSKTTGLRPIQQRCFVLDERNTPAIEILEILIQRLVPFNSTTVRSLLANVKPVTGPAMIGAAAAMSLYLAPTPHRNVIA